MTSRHAVVVVGAGPAGVSARVSRIGEGSTPSTSPTPGEAASTARDRAGAAADLEETRTAGGGDDRVDVGHRIR